MEYVKVEYDLFTRREFVIRKDFKSAMIEAIRLYWPVRSNDLAMRRIKSAVKLLRV